MRLKQIKLTGFKSFVDPTNIPLPSSLVAVVGPNGCGKSNIIDAIRWVMGESSAKQLRGESMADVIFNGSSNRKPVGYASVELIFDNADGSLAGPYSQYAEISIKRQVNRDGESTYYLNNTVCRRRDIKDIFLGTGLGPRSYAIIEQGMISRFIEAKPDDMRIYLEEVAGISKYKERRHETELKINHTVDNLNRLNDIFSELEKQTQHLEKQAHSAEKYKELKQQERLLKAQLLVVRWQNLKTQMDQETEIITLLEAELSTLTQGQQAVEDQLEQLRDETHNAQHDVQAKQQQHFELSGQINHLQQALIHAHERKNQINQESQQTQRDVQRLSQQLSNESQALEQLAATIAELQPQAESSQQLAEDAQNSQQSAEQYMQAWTARWDEFQRNLAQFQQRAQVEQTQIQHLDQRLQTSQNLCQRLSQEEAQQNFSHLETEIEQLEHEQIETESQKEQCQQNLAELQHEINTVREQASQLTHSLDQARRELQKAHGQHASLLALQEHALGNKDEAIQTWLQQHQLQDKPRLATLLQVTPGWEAAVEIVLGHFVQALYVEELPAADLLNQNLPAGILTFVKPTSKASTATDARLSRYVKTDLPVYDLLNSIHVAEDLASAQAALAQIPAHESIITRDGIWLSHAWLRLSQESEANTGILARQRELQALENQLQVAENKEQELQEQVEQNKDDLQNFESRLANEQRLYGQYTAQFADMTAQLKIKQSQHKQYVERREQIQRDLQEQLVLQTELQSKLADCKNNLQQAELALEQNQAQEDALRDERDQHRQQLEQSKMQAQQHQESAHHFALQLQTSLTQQQLKQQNCQNVQTQIEELSQRLENLRENLLQADEPLTELQMQLDEKKVAQPHTEQALQDAKENCDLLEKRLRSLEHARGDHEHNLTEVRDKLAEHKLSQNSVSVRANAFEEQLAESQQNIDEILPTLAENADANELEQTLQKVTNRIERLGAINLAAIDELSENQTRKNELGTQLADLNEALTTLQDAIAKIDKETRATFKETFDKVNETFTSLFPRLFGGGRASLDLTSDDLLTTGVSVMAQPPGKRNSHIHLLSGGEKALTAVALVFAIFQLNPAPFCLLDEVDAPLDDANVGRFCKLVKELSEKVQFIFISHNKLAIEMGEQLVGVTMHEPGVSRLVAVDIRQAMELATA